MARAAHFRVQGSGFRVKGCLGFKAVLKDLDKGGGNEQRAIWYLLTTVSCLYRCLLSCRAWCFMGASE